MPQNSSCTATYHPSRKPSILDKQDTARELRTNSRAMHSGGPLHTDEQGSGNQLEPICNSSVRIQDVGASNGRQRLETSGGIRSGKSMLAARHGHEI